MPSINYRQSLSLQMGISKERAIAVINIIMSALFVCTVAVALFDLLSFSILNGIFFLFLCLSIDTREQSCIVLNHYFFLTMTVVCT